LADGRPGVDHQRGEHAALAGGAELDGHVADL
jgi:hypothetical protein